MSFDTLAAVLGKPVQPPETTTFVPNELRMPEPDDVDEDSTDERQLEEALMRISQRSRRLRISGGIAGPGRVITKRDL